MREENFDYLKEQVKMTGFGESLADQLKEAMQKGDAEFQLHHQIKHGADKDMNYTLNFKKSATQDNYFFNSFDAALNTPGNGVENRFYTDQRITAKEAFNLLEGRSVEKKYNHNEKDMVDGKEVYRAIKDSTYNVWVKLDFNDADSSGNFKTKTYGEKWGFDLEAKISELPIKQLANAEDKMDLLNSLKKGNVQSVSFDINGTTESRYVEANPKAWSINVYDANMQAIKEKVQSKNVTSEKTEKKDQKQSQKANDENPGANPQKKSRKRIQKV